MSIWTTNRLDQLQAAIRTGRYRSAAELGNLLNCSRGAVIGACNRYGISLPRTNNGGGKHKVRGLPNKLSYERHYKLNYERHSTAAPTNQIITGVAPAIMALHPKHCRWPIGELNDPSFHFCCATTIDGSSYCIEHNVMAYKKAQISIRPMRWRWK